MELYEAIKEETEDPSIHDEFGVSQKDSQGIHRVIGEVIESLDKEEEKGKIQKTWGLLVKQVLVALKDHSINEQLLAVFLLGEFHVFCTTLDRSDWKSQEEDKE